MTKQHRPHQNQTQVRVVAQAHDNTLSSVWFFALAFILAGVFYFWGYYYFWAYLWRVLTGG
jgi:signal transduction histidine kinase